MAGLRWRHRLVSTKRWQHELLLGGLGHPGEDTLTGCREFVNLLDAVFGG
jgi:hypothetical protein